MSTGGVGLIRDVPLGMLFEVGHEPPYFRVAGRDTAAEGRIAARVSDRARGAEESARGVERSIEHGRSVQRSLLHCEPRLAYRASAGDLDAVDAALDAAFDQFRQLGGSSGVIGNADDNRFPPPCAALEDCTQQPDGVELPAIARHVRAQQADLDAIDEGLDGEQVFRDRLGRESADVGEDRYPARVRARTRQLNSL